MHLSKVTKIPKDYYKGIQVAAKYEAQIAMTVGFTTKWPTNSGPKQVIIYYKL